MDKIKQLIKNFDFDLTSIKVGIAYFIYKVVPYIILTTFLSPGIWGLYAIILGDGIKIIKGPSWTALFKILACIELLAFLIVAIGSLVHGTELLYSWAQKTIKNSS